MSVGEAVQPAANFYDIHKTELAGLFEVLGQDLPSRAEIVAATQPWVQGDHFDPLHRIELNDSKTTAAKILFAKMGLVDAWPAPAGRYDQAVILGGTMRANNIRTEFAAQALAESNPGQQQGVTLKPDAKIMFWGGPRARDDELELLYTTESLRATEKLADPWLTIQRQLPIEARITDETAQGRLALLRYFGHQAASRISLRLHQGQVPDTTPPISDYQLRHTTESGRPDLIVANAAPVSRQDIGGKPRHTSRSCAQEWLAGPHAPRDGAIVLLISSNPYIARTTRDIQQTVYEAGRDVTMVGCGPAAYPDARTHLFFGELGRLLYLDQASRL